MSGRNLSWFDWRIALVLIVIAGSFAAVLAFPEWVPLRYIWAAAVATAAFASPRATLVVGIFATFAAVLGTLLVGNARAPLFWVDIIGYLLLVALSYVIAVRRSRSEELLRTQATTDALTGLANRRLLVDRLQAQLQVRGADQSSAVIYADLDDFKTVNDNFGHTIGDEVLIRASERLLGCVQEADTIARFGGDEFV
ncbi:MAG: GGDEF domain-containing protein, partial [Actinomycetota bacterium]|nr:GGDEF domain-containing protein [Actinomycetota bacterium]